MGGAHIYNRAPVLSTETSDYYSQFIQFRVLCYYKDNLFYFIPSSESSAYLKQIKCILSTVKKYRIFSLVTDTIFIFSL